MKEKITNLLGGMSGGAGLLGAFSVCHNVCLGIIALLGVVGIALVGMPLAGPFQFFEKYSLLFIYIGLLSISISIYMYVQHRKRECRKLDYKIALYGAVLLLLLVGLFNAVFFKDGVSTDAFATDTQENYEKAQSAQLDDPCATPPGYTDEDWKRHMSHHPDMYAECL